MDLLVEATAALYVDDDETCVPAADLTPEEANALVKIAWRMRYEVLLEEFNNIGAPVGNDRDWFAKVLYGPIKRACALLPGRGVPPEDEEHALNILNLLDHAIFKLLDSLLQRTMTVQIVIGLGYVRLLLDEYIPSMQSALDAISRGFGENKNKAIKETCKELRDDADMTRKALQKYCQQQRYQKQPQRLHIAAMENLRTEMEALVHELTDPAEDEMKEHLRAEFEAILQSKWPECQLKIFGSSKSTLGFKGSDMDLCLLLPMDARSCRAAEAEARAALEDPESHDGELGAGPKNTPAHRFQARIVVEMVEMLTDGPHGGVFEKVEGIPTARVPIVKLVHARTGIQCDVGINSHLGLLNTKLLRLYTELDQRVRPLAFAIKYWAKQRGVNDPSGGTLSSYAWVIMLIHFLQQETPPVLSCLQDLRICQGEDAQQGQGIVFCDNLVQAFSMLPGINRTPVGELLVRFFYYYCYIFSVADTAVSISSMSILNKKDYRASTRQKKWRIAIQDPLEPDHDLGSVVYDPAGEIRIVNELERAIIFVVSGDFKGLCEKAPDRSVIIRSCTSCGESGHVTKDCELGKGACRNCGKVGHYIRDCPEPPSENIGACHKCGGNGHWSRECEGGVDRRTCNRCNQTGHIARDCPQKFQQPCRICNKPGHIARDCKRKRPQQQQQQQTCRNCGLGGHIARDCRAPPPRQASQERERQQTYAPRPPSTGGYAHNQYYDVQRAQAGASRGGSVPGYYQVQAAQRRSADYGQTPQYPGPLGGVNGDRRQQYSQSNSRDPRNYYD